jgi:molybdopterin-guanine dinucleotide biosynthesis protein A
VTWADPVAVLLAGGAGRRMGGGDKSLSILSGRPILTHVVARVRPQVSALVLNANGDPARFADWGLPVVADLIPENPGPLAGIHAGMVWAGSHGATDIVSIPTDLPFLPTDLIEQLSHRRGDDDIAVAGSAGQAHPVVALWPVRLAVELHRAVTMEAMRKVTAFAARYRVAYVDFSVGEIDPFFNVNTPEDLQRAQTLA